MKTKRHILHVFLASFFLLSALLLFSMQRAYAVEQEGEYLYSSERIVSGDYAYEIHYFDNSGDGQADYSFAVLLRYLGNEKRIEIPEYLDGNLVIGAVNAAFRSCNSLESVVMPDSFTELGPYVFLNCSNLKKVTLSKQMEELSYETFYNCSSLEEVELFDGLKTIDTAAFYGCSKLVSIDIPNSVTYIGGSSFYGCSSLKRINIPDGITWISAAAFEGCSSLENMILPSGVTVLEPDCFYGCSSLKSINIPDGVTSIGDYAFCNCSSLESVVLPPKTESIGEGAFEGCSQLKEVNIPYGVEKLDHATFSDCSSLASIAIPSSVQEIGNAVFSSCSSLKTVKIPEGVTSLNDRVFSYCSSLTSIIIPNSVTLIDNAAFVDCSSIEEIVLPNRLTRIGEWAFYFCSSLVRANIPDTVKSIGKNAFTGCPLKKVVIPNGVEKIEKETFQYCQQLTSVTIPASITSIEKNAFNMNYQMHAHCLKDVYYYGSATQWSEISIDIGNDDLLDATLHCISGEVLVESLELNKNTLILANGTSETLVATVNYWGYSNEDLVWESSDKSVATVNQNGRVTAKREGITFITAHIGVYENIMAECKVIVRGFGSGVYSLGEETYCYHNIDGGCCFGMALTSSMYHLGLLYRPVFGVESNALYDCYLWNINNEKMPTDEDREIIHYFQGVQGVFPALSATVAGTIPGLNIRPHPEFVSPYGSVSMQWRGIETDWYQVKNYVNRHQFDNKGSLIISFELSYVNGNDETETHQHTVNFLRYEEVDGQERIYTYDSNNPDAEMFFYQDIDGSIKHSNYSNEFTSFSVNTLSLEDVYKYANAAAKFKKSHAIYAKESNIVVENTLSSAMSGDFESDTRQIMYEIPDNLTQVRIAPLTDHAEFTYMDQVYHIDREDENTIGILTLAQSENDTGILTIVNDPDNHVHIYTGELTIEPTCTQNGELTCICSRCGDTVIEAIDALCHYDNDNDGICDDCGEPMPYELHTHTYTSTVTIESTCAEPGVMTFTCECGDTYTEPISATGNHVDADNDGHCDTCGEQMTGGDHCAYCGKIHDGAFGWLVRFFHKIFALFKR